ncbi:MAG: hypothetical protein J6Q92_03155 [Oscillospiraceae bacterium]|nr:hypothetical protein [Oscillospiraceae bacterium]
MEETKEIDIKELAKELWRRAWIIVLCAVMVASAMLIYTAAFVTPQYTAEVLIYVNNNSDRTNNYLSSADLAVALRLVGTYVNILKSDAVLTEVIAKAGVDMNPEQVRGMMTAEVVEETEIFRVSITSANAQMSADIVNAIADAAPEKIAAIIEGSSAKVIDYANVPEEPSSPSLVKNSVIGGVIGVVLAVIAIAVQMVLDKRIKSEEDLMKLYPIPVLGKIPDMSLSREKHGKKKERR